MVSSYRTVVSISLSEYSGHMFAFWFITVVLLICAFGFVLPGLATWRMRIFLSFLMVFLSYGLYFQWGSSRYLKQYYSQAEQQERQKRIPLRKLLTAFKKEEFRLRIRLEENPKDIEAEWRLLDFLAIKALQNEDKALAHEYWKTALKKIPNSAETKAIRNRIRGALKMLKDG